ncbi:hypothetical protein [Bradyrhizobium sp. CB3481]|uniref:hypothetical protein n=1 Tax=Bradyrhizobium sp. CB3481 TaxID=3039158 RepID=UPI0024B0DB4C|nr:hypothetical protein [Bradyrhizobium sp. CB3481]WFU19720.1 hypothetical protein QA643_15995 [Bradyrhizobium sp. CB3481]
MRQILKGLIAAVAVMVAAPAMACGYAPCAAPIYAAPAVSYGYAGCGPCGGWVRERLPDPEQQYYWVNQGPTYTGPGNFAPYPVYREGTISGYGYGYNRPYYRAHRHYHGHRYSYSGRYYQGRPVLRRYY